ncbi:MAG: HrgA protein [Alphaproteobacteria bacterium]|nr:HrgA protein [Alphaproteobacteria bacterium]
MTLNLGKTVEDILKREQEKGYTAKQLAQEIFRVKTKDCLEKMEKSKATVIPLNSEEALIDQIAKEIGARKKWFLSSDKIKMTSERPRKYYYSEKSDAEEVKEAEKETKTNKHQEHDSYPKLCEYLYNELSVFPKRINEKRSSNSKGNNGNKWLHPDIVGLKNLSEGWDKDVIACSNQHAFNKTSLWSFEVKITINLSNVRECFFQTVSNSSWANYSYLVAQSIDERAMDELRILCGGHNIGVIQLNCEDPSESQILIPAIEKKELDWDMIDRIAKENPDFKDFINLITEFYQTGKIKDRDWDIPKAIED